MNYPASRRFLLSFFACIATLSSIGGESPETPADRGVWGTVSDMVDRLPTVLANRLPGLDPNGLVRVSVQPHLGDFFHDGYIRIPVGVRMKLSEHVQANTDLLGFVAHGIDAPTSPGLAMVRLGLKYQKVISTESLSAYSVGFDYQTPLEDAPRQFTDGFRHFQPYITTTRLLVPKWDLLGYSTFRLNFLEHTSHPANYIRNQLHGNSMSFTEGVVREWKHMQLSLSARVATTALMNDETHWNFWLRPEIAVPWRLSASSRTQLLFTLHSRVFWGQDGMVTSSGVGVRFQFNFDRERRMARLL